jgi:hypothetical protein
MGDAYLLKRKSFVVNYSQNEIDALLVWRDYLDPTKASCALDLLTRDIKEQSSSSISGRTISD